MRRCEVVYFIYVARDRDHFRDFGTSASHMTHEDFRSVECVIIITLILRSEQRLLYVIFQIFPRFHFPVHKHRITVPIFRHTDSSPTVYLGLKTASSSVGKLLNRAGVEHTASIFKAEYSRN